MTTVIRSHRGRGVAEALKRTEIAWAAAHGYRQLTTSTHSDNEPMRRLNEKLGYRELPAILDVARPL
jgi:mycothiol synthase